MAPLADRPDVGARRWGEGIPGLTLARSYERSWLPKDIVAGLVLSALLVPQGMAYAQLAGLPPVTGLYTSILCLIGYAIFGPSRVLVLGPDSSLGPMIAATILPLLLAGGDPARAVALASMLAVIVGIVMVVAGLAGFGFVADLLSRPTQIGYMNGLALTIIIGQLPKLFGFSTDASGLVAEANAFLSGLFSGAANPTAAVIGVSALVGILVLNRFIPKIPSVLVAVTLTAVAVNLSRPGGRRGRHGRRAPARPPQLHDPAGGLGRRAATLSGGPGHRRRRARRHDVHGLELRGPQGRTRPWATRR